MEFVNSVYQCTAIIEDYPDILRPIVSIQVDVFDCAKLYRTLFTTRCSTCNCFGYYLYLIDRLSPCLLLLFHRSSSPSQVARHTGSSPPMQNANSSSWWNYQASWAWPCDTVVRGTIVGGGGIDHQAVVITAYGSTWTAWYTWTTLTCTTHWGNLNIVYTIGHLKWRAQLDLT